MASRTNGFSPSWERLGFLPELAATLYSSKLGKKQCLPVRHFMCFPLDVYTIGLTIAGDFSYKSTKNGKTAIESQSFRRENIRTRRLAVGVDAASSGGYLEVAVSQLSESGERLPGLVQRDARPRSHVRHLPRRARI